MDFFECHCHCHCDAAIVFPDQTHSFGTTSNSTLWVLGRNTPYQGRIFQQLLEYLWAGDVRGRVAQHGLGPIISIFSFFFLCAVIVFMRRTMACASVRPPLRPLPANDLTDKVYQRQGNRTLVCVRVESANVHVPCACRREGREGRVGQQHGWKDVQDGPTRDRPMEDGLTGGEEHRRVSCSSLSCLATSIINRLCSSYWVRLQPLAAGQVDWWTCRSCQGDVSSNFDDLPDKFCASLVLLFAFPSNLVVLCEVYQSAAGQPPLLLSELSSGDTWVLEQPRVMSRLGL